MPQYLPVSRPFFPDTTPPTAPVLNATIVTGTNVDLTWSGSTDTETGVVGYVIYVDGNALPIGLIRALGFTVNSMSSGLHSFQVAAVDGAGNLSARSNTQTAQVGVILVGPGTKLIRGNGFWFDNQYWDGANQQVQYNNNIDMLLANPHVDYIQIVLTWPFLERIRGDYSRGKAIIDPILAKLKTVKTRKVGLIVKMWQTFFNTANVTSTGDWPQYVVNNKWVDAFYDTGGHQRTQLKFDIPDVWNALTGMFNFYGDTYNGDDHFYGIGIFDETTAVDFAYTTKDPVTGKLSGAWRPCDATNYNTRYQKMCIDTKAHYPDTLVWVPFNFLPPGGPAALTAMEDMIRAFRQAYPGGFLFGGPDPATSHNVHGNTGGSFITTFQNLIVGKIGTLGNLSGIVPLISHVEEFCLGNTGNPPTKPPVTPDDLYSDAVDGLYKAQILSWNCENWEYYKTADQLAAIARRNGITAPLPTEGKWK